MVHFPAATPEQVGVSSLWIEKFLDRLEQRGIMMHSVMMLRHGLVFAEGYYAPFRQQDKHRMYSISKSFVATAIGMLVDEGRMQLSDKVVSFFPDKVPANAHPYILDMTVRDLLRMATPYSRVTYEGDTEDWTKTFFTSKPDHPPGTVFNYDTSGSHVLTAIVETVAGMPLLDYLRDKGLGALGFSSDAWCVKAPEGTSWGGSGVICTTRDVALLGLLYRNGGILDGKRLLSESYAREATRRQIDNSLNGTRDYLSGHGYGYQIWMTHDDSYTFCGMGGQLMICIPRLDMLFVCTADLQGASSDYQPMFAALWDEIIRNMDAEPLPANPRAAAALAQRLNTLRLALPSGEPDSPFERSYLDKEYILHPNCMGITRLRITRQGDRGELFFTKDGEDKRIPFGFRQYAEGNFPEDGYWGDTISVPAGRPYRCFAAAGWTEPRKLVIRVNIADDYFGNLTITLAFKGSQIALHMIKAAEWFLDGYQGYAGGELADPR